MPLTQLKLEENSQWAIWHITETEAELQQVVNEPVPTEIVSKTKRLEWLASRKLSQELLERIGLSFNGISKNEFGKPSFTGYRLFLSLSHSYPYVAVQISERHEVGIDLEQPKDKLFRIAHRILSSAELQDAGTDVVKHCIYWSAKEALYKIYGKRGLHFNNQLNLEPFTLKQQGKLLGTIDSSIHKQKVTLGYQVNLDFVVVYTLNSQQ